MPRTLHQRLRLLVGLALLALATVPTVANAAATATATARVQGSLVRLDAQNGVAATYAPGSYDPASGVDTFVRFRALAGSISPGAGCATEADGAVACGTHAQSSVYFSSNGPADASIRYVRGGNVTFRDASFYGGSGDDVLIGGPEPDYLSVGDGRDHLDGAEGNDSLYGAGGDDILVGAGGTDYESGGDGTDLLAGGDGGDSLYGGNDADVLHGGAGTDYLSGGDGPDTMNGGPNADDEYAGPGDDTVTDRDGSVDNIRCEDGNDVAPTDAADATYDCESKPAGAADTQPPTVTVSSPTAGQHVAEGSAVPASTSCQDGTGSGVLVCSAPTTVPSRRTDTTYVAAATDRAANIAVATVDYVVDPAPDLPPPGPTTGPGEIPGTPAAPAGDAGTTSTPRPAAPAIQGLSCNPAIAISTPVGQKTSFLFGCSDGGVPISYAVVPGHGPQHGTLTTHDGTGIYRPAPKFSGTDTFQVRASAAGSAPQVEEVTVTVGGPAVAGLGLPSANVCVAGRKLSVHLFHSSGEKLATAKIYRNGRLLVARDFRHAKHRKPVRSSTPIKLTGLSGKSFTLRLVVRTTTGKRRAQTVTYRSCASTLAIRRRIRNDEQRLVRDKRQVAQREATLARHKAELIRHQAKLAKDQSAGRSDVVLRNDQRAIDRDIQKIAQDQARLDAANATVAKDQARLDADRAELTANQ